MPMTIFKTCVSISDMKRPHVTLAASFPFPPSTHPSRGSLNDTPEMITTSSQGATLAPSLWWCRYLAINRRCLHPAHYCSKSSKIIRRTLRRIPSYSKLIKPRSLPLLIQSLGWAETCCSSSRWSAPPSWSSTNMFQLVLVNSFLCSFFNQPILTHSWETISKLSFLNKC